MPNLCMPNFLVCVLCHDSKQISQRDDSSTARSLQTFLDSVGVLRNVLQRNGFFFYFIFFLNLSVKESASGACTNMQVYVLSSDAYD